MERKRTASFRLSETTHRELENLAKKNNISQADVIAVLIHCVYLSGEIREEKLNEWFEIVKLS